TYAAGSHRHRGDPWGRSTGHSAGHGERPRWLHGYAPRDVPAGHADAPRDDGDDERDRDAADGATHADRIRRERHRSGGTRTGRFTAGDPHHGGVRLRRRTEQVRTRGYLLARVQRALGPRASPERAARHWSRAALSSAPAR